MLLSAPVQLPFLVLLVFWIWDKDLDLVFYIHISVASLCKFDFVN